MVTVRTPMVLLVALLASSPAFAQKSGTSAYTTAAHTETARWREYTDRDHHFCFRYPRSYTSIPHPTPMCRGPKLEDKMTGATIGICVDDQDFDLTKLVRSAPTGIESPPEPVRIGKNTFYYYGPGGGGVSYPDGYFFNLHGKMLSIYFDGPYVNDKTPTPATKKMERKLLATFREF